MLVPAGYTAKVESPPSRSQSPVQRTFRKDGSKKDRVGFSECTDFLEAVPEDLSFVFLSATGLMVTLCPVF